MKELTQIVTAEITRILRVPDEYDIEAEMSVDGQIDPDIRQRMEINIARILEADHVNVLKVQDFLSEKAE